MVKLDFGIRDYDEVLSLQKYFVDLNVKKPGQDYFLIGEHYPVITLGIRPQQKRNLKATSAQFHSKNIKIREIRRGGFATYHGPGQIVGYPIFNLRRNNLKVKEFIYKIESALMLTLKKFDIAACRKKGLIGVWVKDKKIVSIGVGVNRGISYHGFALNVNTDLSKFDYIIPCGLANIKMVSMQKIKNSKISLSKVKKECINSIMDIFGIDEIINYKGAYHFK